MIRIAVPGVLTLLLVAAFIAVSGWNRTGDPSLVLVVTERELSLPWRPSQATDDDPGLHPNAQTTRVGDPGLQLRFQYEQRREPIDARNWLTDDRLRALGFALNVPPGAPEAMEAYRRVPPRIGWVVFEYGGPVWTEFNRRRAMRTNQDPRGSLMEPSRLVPIDAGPEFEPLHARYPSGHLILRSVIQLRVDRIDAAGTIVYGTIGELVPETVTVPRHLRPLLDGVPPVNQTPQLIAPRYEVDLALGRAGIPYITNLRRIGI